MFTKNCNIYDYRKHLSDWLHKRGKSLGNFHHLHCFGLKASNITHGGETRKRSCKPPAVNCRENKQTEVKGNYASDTEPSALRSEQEEPVEENKENVCAGNLDLIVQDAVNDLLNIVRIVSIN
jgi:hypothetical protein